MDWDPERVELLKKLWMEGQTAGEIAKIFGCTRNSVIGKIHRTIGPNVREPRPQQRARVPRAPRPQRSYRVPRSLLDGHPIRTARTSLPALFKVPDDGFACAEKDLAIPAEQRKGIMELDQTHCRWIIGNPGESERPYCGDIKYNGSPYCERHHQQVYLPLQVLRARQAQDKYLIRSA